MTNLLSANMASIETDTTGWIVNANATLARSTAQGLAGSASLAMTSAAAGNVSVRIDDAYAPAATPGVTYTICASFRAATATRQVEARLRFLDVNKTQLTSTSVNIPTDTTSGWTQVINTAVAPANTVYLSTFLVALSTGAAGEVHYVDCIGAWVGSSSHWPDGVQQGYEPTWIAAQALYGNANHYIYEMKKFGAPSAPKTTYPTATGGTTYPVAR
jgi:hypothetical protein